MGQHVVDTWLWHRCAQHHKIPMMMGQHVVDTWLLHRCAQHPKIPFILTSKTTLSENYAVVLKLIFFWTTCIILKVKYLHSGGYSKSVLFLVLIMHSRFMHIKRVSCGATFVADFTSVSCINFIHMPCFNMVFNMLNVF